MGASTCGVNDSSVVDLQGRNSSVSIREDGSISAFVLSIGDGPSANELAARLYSSYFRLVLESIALNVRGHEYVADSIQNRVGAVTFKPEAFVPMVSTATSTATSTTMSTAASTVTGPTPISAAVVTTTEVSSTETTAFAADIRPGPPWWSFGAVGIGAGGAAAAVVLLAQKCGRVRMI